MENVGFKFEVVCAQLPSNVGERSFWVQQNVKHFHLKNCGFKTNMPGPGLKIAKLEWFKLKG